MAGSLFYISAILYIIFFLFLQSTKSEGAHYYYFKEEKLKKDFKKTKKQNIFIVFFLHILLFHSTLFFSRIGIDKANNKQQNQPFHATLKIDFYSIFSFYIYTP